jgi:hypothetical protein
MKPADVYAMPTHYTLSWHEGPDGLMSDVFGVDSEHFDLRAAADSGDYRIECHLKMAADLDGYREATVHALTVDGRPFGIYASSDGEAQFIVTNMALHAEAVRLVEEWRIEPRVGVLAHRDAELRELDSFGGMSVVSTPDGLRLVKRRYSDGGGTLVFDEARFHEALKEHVGKLVIGGVVNAAAQAAEVIGGHREGSLGHFERGSMPDAGQRRLIAGIIRRGVPDGIRSVIVDEMPRDTVLDDDFSLNGCEFETDWTAAVVATENGTYALRVPAKALSENFNWARHVSCQRLGSPDLFEEYACEATSPVP